MGCVCVCVHVCVCVCVYVCCAQSCLTLCNPMDCSLTGSSVHGILQTRMLEWVTISSSRGSSQPRDWICISCVSCIAGGLFTTEPSRKPQTRACIVINHIAPIPAGALRGWVGRNCLLPTESVLGQAGSQDTYTWKDTERVWHTPLLSPQPGFPGSLQGPPSFLALTPHLGPSRAAVLLCFTGGSPRSSDQMSEMAGNEKPRSCEAESERWFSSSWFPVGEPHQEPLPMATQFQLLCFPFGARQITLGFLCTGTNCAQKP